MYSKRTCFAEKQNTIGSKKYAYRYDAFAEKQSTILRNDILLKAKYQQTSKNINNKQAKKASKQPSHLPWRELTKSFFFS